MDGDLREMSSKERQKRIEEKLLTCYAQELASIINELVVKKCNGCIIDHPSQRQHPCITMENDERLWSYFNDALLRISEEEVLKAFVRSLSNMKPCVHGLELLKYTCNDWCMNCVLCRSKRLT